MKYVRLTSLAAGTLASAALVLAGSASAAPSGPASVDATLSQLRAHGYAVILNRTGTAQMSQCTVTDVRPGQTFSRTDSGAPGARNELATTVTAKTVYVSVAC